ncbi:hypothetical protein GQX74_012814 [Glossina fuscipes]|nr:hypothetical protein GQX74_012814 [Glossina fuscipes]
MIFDKKPIHKNGEELKLIKVKSGVFANALYEEHEQSVTCLSQQQQHPHQLHHHSVHQQRPQQQRQVQLQAGPVHLTHPTTANQLSAHYQPHPQQYLQEHHQASEQQHIQQQQQ